MGGASLWRGVGFFYLRLATIFKRTIPSLVLLLSFIVLSFLHSLLLSFSFASHDPIALGVELLHIFTFLGTVHDRPDGSRMTPALYTRPYGFAMVPFWERTNTEG